MDSSRSINIFDEERKTIFGKIYLANVKNRLRELTNPTNIDCKRWIWELVQNAKDSISGKKTKKEIDIEINVENDLYIFKHNGAPFTKKTLTGLLYKFSEGKKNNEESIGRFGTGFLTTHSLSKTVKLRGDIILKNNSPQGFDITLFREGEDEKLLKGLEQTEKSFVTPIKNDGWTKFEYIANTDRNKEAGKLGIENLKENIAKVMLFCPKIKSLKLNENGQKFLIEKGEIIDCNFKNVQKVIFKFKDGNQSTKSKIFLYLHLEEYNDELTKKFAISRNVRISCAIELDKGNNIIYRNNSTSLFCSLPLIGSESHELPFILDSPDFEPDSERQAILLDGDEINKVTGKITDQGINKMILLKAKDMFKILIEYICQNRIKNRHLLFKGITNVPSVIKFFDYNWYKNHFFYNANKANFT